MAITEPKTKRLAFSLVRVTGGLLEWNAKERCSAKFYDVNDVRKKQSALHDIVNQWIKQM